MLLAKFNHMLITLSFAFISSLRMEFILVKLIHMRSTVPGDRNPDPYHGNFSLM